MVRHALSFIPAAVLAIGLAVPAHAAETVTLPEPGMLTMLALGAAGVLIGRRLSSKRPRDAKRPREN